MAERMSPEPSEDWKPLDDGTREYLIDGCPGIDDAFYFELAPKLWGALMYTEQRLRAVEQENRVQGYDRVHEGRAVLMPIPQFLRDDPRCFYAFDPTHPEFGIDSQGRECFAIDVGIAEAVQLLWDAGIKTIGCCDGHGSGDGIIAVATHDDGSPHDGLDDHDPYRPVIHSAERRAVHALKQENRVLRDAAAEALGYLTQLRETSDAFSRMECASRAHAVLDGALARAGGGADAAV